jgi:hypothetical protein
MSPIWIASFTGHLGGGAKAEQVNLKEILRDTQA